MADNDKVVTEFGQAVQEIKQAVYDANGWYHFYSLDFVGETDDPEISTDREHTLCGEIYPLLDQISAFSDSLTLYAAEKFGLSIARPQDSEADPSWLPTEESGREVVPAGAMDVADGLNNAAHQLKRSVRRCLSGSQQPGLNRKATSVIAGVDSLCQKFDALAEEVVAESKKMPWVENRARIEAEEAMVPGA